MKFKHYQTKAKFLTDLGDSKINNGDICYIKDTQEIYTHGQYYRGCLSDYAQNDSTQPDYIKNRTHYVESVSTSDVWYQTNVEVGSGTSSPGAYSGTFNLTEGKTYNVTISQGSNTKTYEGIVCENNTTVSGLFLNKNWSNPMYGAETTSDAFYILVKASSVILASADVYGSSCTVQVSEVTETIHKLDPKYLPDNVNQLEDITTSKSGKVTTVTFEQTNGTETQFQVTDGADGTNGKSAYQVAVDNGYSGTETQWLASLKGADGVSLGEVELTQEITTATDSVPANKAVYDKVQRVDVEKANKSDYNDSQWLQDQGWKLDYRLFRNTETAASGYCVSPMFPFVYGHTYTLSYQFNANNNCTFSFFTDEEVYKEYYSCNVNKVRTVTATASSLSSCTQMRGTFSLSNIRQCYIHDDTANEYIFKGDEYLDSLTAESNKEFDKLIDYKTYRDELLVQELNQSTTQVPSAKAVQDGIDNVVLNNKKNTVVISPDCVVRGTSTPLTSVDKYKFDELNTIEVVFMGVPSMGSLNWFDSKTLCEIKKDDSNYIRWRIDGYGCKALIVVGGETLLSQTFTINSGTLNLNQYVNYAAAINLYQKVMRIIGADRDDGSIVVIYEVDISNVDISSFEGGEVNINSHIDCYWSDYYCIYVRVNCYDEIGGQLNTNFYSGHYNVFPTYNLESKLGYNEYITGLGLGGTITETISPTHKKCSATNQSGFFRISPTVSLADSAAPDHISWSVKFKLISGNITITSGVSGTVYIRDTNGNKVTMIEQGVEYILYVREGDNTLSYSLTFGVRASGTFELEVWEPKLFFQQSQIICAETWNGSMFTGAIPYSATPNFRQIATKDASTGGVWFPIGELRLSGTNIQMFNGTTWKQINNS